MDEEDYDQEYEDAGAAWLERENEIARAQEAESAWRAQEAESAWLDMEDAKAKESAEQTQQNASEGDDQQQGQQGGNPVAGTQHTPWLADEDLVMCYNCGGQV